MKKFILGTLIIVIIALVLKNTAVFSTIIKSVSDMFNASFRAVTSAENFK
ncbi:MAG TPA: hypothetical protein VH815_10290 [Acidobacteriota bacterium]|jgi:Flp pilus assembly pilin Flp